MRLGDPPDTTASEMEGTRKGWRARLAQMVEKASGPKGRTDRDAVDHRSRQEEPS